MDIDTIFVYASKSKMRHSHGIGICVHVGAMKCIMYLWVIRYDKSIEPSE